MPTIAVCIPIYNASRVIGATLRSVQNQSWADLEIILSIDPGDDDTAEKCTAWAREDSRIQLFFNDKQLGWGGNVRASMGHITADWWSVLPHDDIWAPNYLEALWDCLEQSGGADFSYCDIQNFRGQKILGTKSVHALDSSLAVERLFSFCQQAAEPTAWHGLFPAWIADKIPFPAEPYNFPALDNLWIAQVLAQAKGIRLPSALYFKRMGSKELANVCWEWKQNENRTHVQQGWDEIEAGLKKAMSSIEGCNEQLLEAAQLANDVRRWNLRELEDHPDIEQLYQRWCPNDTEQKTTTTADRWIIAARCSAIRGDIERALQEVERATTSSGSSWRGWHLWANLLLKKGCTFEACEKLNSGLQLYPNENHLNSVKYNLGQRMFDKLAMDSAECPSP